MCGRRLQSVGRRYESADGTWEAVVIVVREKGADVEMRDGNEGSEGTVREWDELEMTEW